MDRRSPHKPNAQILEEASNWFVELSEGEISASGREEFTAWLRASPEHVRAFLQISAVWEDAPLLGNKGATDIEALLAAARSDSNVVPLGKSAPPRITERWRNPTHKRVGRFVGWAFAASIMAAAVGASLWVQWYRGLYTTGIGETRWVGLADGSSIELNAESRIRVRLSGTERDVDLLRGQALFHVTKDPSRPFIVHSGPVQITDIGTQFDVYRRRTDTLVTVIEGRVAVRAAPAPNPMSSPSPPSGRPPSSTGVPARLDGQNLGTIIAAGEQVDLTQQARPTPVRADITAATAWTRQMLVFSSAPLDEVVSQYNLYHEKRLVIQDASLANYHVSGVFSATDSAALVAFLRAQPTLSVREMDDEIDISSQ